MNKRISGVVLAVIISIVVSRVLIPFINKSNSINYVSPDYERLQKLMNLNRFSKDATHKTLEERMSMKENIHIDTNGKKYLKSFSGTKYPMSAIDFIVESVTMGKIGGDDLVEIVNKLPRFLADGYPLRKVLLEEMQKLEKKVSAEAGETTVKKTEKEN